MCSRLITSAAWPLQVVLGSVEALLVGYSLSIISNSEKNNEEILITNGKDMPKGRNVLLNIIKGKSKEKLEKREK